MNDNSVQFEVYAAVAAILGGEAQRAYRCRFEAFELDELPCDNVIPNRKSLEYLTTDDVENLFEFDVRYQACSSVRDADMQADARYVRGSRLLLADPTLGLPYVRTIREVNAKWEMEKAAVNIVALVVTYEVEFSTTRRDPSLPGY